MRTKPTASVKPKEKISVSEKPARRLITGLERQMAEVQALREEVRKAEAKVLMR